jgi:hypothetical protein
VARRSKTRVHLYSEGGFLVRGTRDPHEALKLAVAADEDFVLGGYYCTPDWEDGIHEEGSIDILADTMHAWLKCAHPGRYRIVPVNPRAFDDCTWRTYPAGSGGNGTFDAVEFRP